jgi:uncharacterized protein with HEPN domain
MSPEDSELAFVWDMLDAAQSGVDMVSGRSLEDFTADHTAKLAMERAMEIIGEAACRIGQSTRDAHPEVPWKLIIGQRNIIAHNTDASIICSSTVPVLSENPIGREQTTPPAGSSTSATRQDDPSPPRARRC